MVSGGPASRQHKGADPLAPQKSHGTGSEFPKHWPVPADDPLNVPQVIFGSLPEFGLVGALVANRKPVRRIRVLQNIEISGSTVP